MNEELDKERTMSRDHREEIEQLKASLEELQVLQKQLDAYKLEVKDKEAVMEEGEAEAAELQRALQKQVRYSKSLEAEVESLNAVISMRAEKEKDRKNEEVRVVKEMYEGDIGRLKHRIEELEAAIEIKDEKVQRSAASVAEAEGKLEAAHAIETQLKAEIAQLSQHLETADVQLENAGIPPTPRATPHKDGNETPVSRSRASSEVVGGFNPDFNPSRQLQFSDDDDI